MEKFINWAEKLKAISHPIRLYILDRMINDNYNLNDIMAQFKVSQPAISQHIAILRRMNIIKCEKNGIFMCYKINDRSIEELIKKIFKEG